MSPRKPSITEVLLERHGQTVADELGSSISELLVTDTASLGHGSPKLTVLSIAPLLADTIDAMFAGRSVSTIFAGQEAF